MLPFYYIIAKIISKIFLGKMKTMNLDLRHFIRGIKYIIRGCKGVGREFLGIVSLFWQG